MSWGALLVHATESFLDLNEAYNKSKIIDAQSKLNETLAGIEADQLVRQATLAENVGVREGQVEQYKTRVMASDATAQMAASGAEVDPEMLARIKQRGDYNTMSAIFDARSRAIELRGQAGMTRIGAAYDKGAAGRYGDSLKREAKTRVTFNALDLMPSTFKMPTKNAKPKSYATSASGGRVTHGGIQQ